MPDPLQSDKEKCPCGSGLPYEACCGLYHSGTDFPDTAEALMRSRYSAYAKSAIDYICATTHPQRRSPHLKDNLRAICQQTSWLGLEVLETTNGGPQDKIGKVHFIATYSEGSDIRQLEQVSRFKRYEGRWYYCPEA